jgi:hypothetical protein
MAIVRRHLCHVQGTNFAERHSWIWERACSIRATLPRTSKALFPRRICNYGTIQHLSPQKL